VAEQFFQKAPTIAEQLRTDFKYAVGLLSTPVETLRQMQAEGALPDVPGLSHLLEYLERLPRHLQPWVLGKPLPGSPLSPLLEKLSPQWMLVAPIAHPGDSHHVAVRLLRARLAQDTAERLRVVPPPELYVYDEPLACWLARLLDGSAK